VSPENSARFLFYPELGLHTNSSSEP
jgi:hypothetical protein